MITLRSFLRFASSRGYLSHDLSDTMIHVPRFSLDRLPRGPKWADMAKLPTTVGRATVQRRRDVAVLLMLITYGVRRGQLVGAAAATRSLGSMVYGVAPLNPATLVIVPAAQGARCGPRGHRTSAPSDSDRSGDCAQARIV